MRKSLKVIQIILIVSLFPLIAFGYFTDEIHILHYLWLVLFLFLYLMDIIIHG